MTRTVTPSGAAYRGAEVQLDLLSLAAGEPVSVVAPPNDEVVVVLVQGSVHWLGMQATRASVFTQRASAVYVPPGGGVNIGADETCEIALVATSAGDLAPRGKPIAINPADVSAVQRGEPGWQREVHDVIADAVPAQRLLVGETFNAAGEWSSFPPHKHDGRDGEAALEEVYYYRFDKPDGFGFQGLYERDGDERRHERAVFLRHGAVVGFAAGFHPVCAAPGYRLYYLWALAGKERRLTMYEDPAHRWLHTAP
ncbi:MAG: 5-deoxy-glucuronate isomerase [Actinomycetia bacterium]|nr:5-deoxy-glucuronate isomerase [Actinomycetes bacterium]